MSDSKNSDSVTVRSDGFASGSIALLFITFVLGLISVASLLSFLIRALHGGTIGELEVKPDFLLLIRGIGVAVVALQLRAYHLSYLRFLQGEEIESFKVQSAKLWNIIGCFFAVLLAYGIITTLWVSFQIWSSPAFTPGKYS